jgi:NADPH:quinone reductase-like Zn-dependent oxidoreductase
MLAARFHRHGPPEALQYEEAPDPRPAPGRALIRVRACALNHLDLWERRGIERVSIPLPHISGSDVAGEVADSGGGNVQPGTRVLLHPGLSCGRCDRCVEGRDNLCPKFDVLGLLSDGGYAELVSVPVENVLPIPDHISFVQAAAFPLTFLTASHMLNAAKMREGEVVLVLAGGSGVGQAAIQIARLRGGTVLATAGPDKMERTRELGAEAVFDHYDVDFGKQARAFTRGRGVDIVIEHVGEATWDRSVRALANGGRVVTCGATSGPHVSLDLRHLFARQLSFIGSYMGTKAELAAVARLFFDGRLRPVVDEIFPLSAAAEAQRRLEDRKHFGKIVLTPE